MNGVDTYSVVIPAERQRVRAERGPMTGSAREPGSMCHRLRLRKHGSRVSLRSPGMTAGELGNGR